MQELLRTLADAYACGPRMKQFLDNLLGQQHANQPADLRVVFAEADLLALLRLRRAIADNRLIARSYVQHRSPGEESGCLMYWLFGLRSNAQVLAYPYRSAEMVKAFARTVRGWDWGSLHLSTICATLEEEVQRREQCQPFLQTDAAADHAWSEAPVACVEERELLAV